MTREHKAELFEAVNRLFAEFKEQYKLYDYNHIEQTVANELYERPNRHRESLMDWYSRHDSGPFSGR